MNRDIEPYERAVGDAVKQLAEEAGVPAELLADVPGSSAEAFHPSKPTLPKPPPAGIQPGPKWDSLSRAERRQLARHHRKVTGG